MPNFVLAQSGEDLIQYTHQEYAEEFVYKFSSVIYPWKKSLVANQQIFDQRDRDNYPQITHFALDFEEIQDLVFHYEEVLAALYCDQMDYFNSLIGDVTNWARC